MTQILRKNNGQMPLPEFFQLLVHGKLNLIDVRSEQEHALGSIPRAVNLPLLNSQHRSLVGTRYKKQGADEAIKLAHHLVGPLKEDLCAQWASILSADNGVSVVHCWRGGLRSETVVSWLREKQIAVVSLLGGYKSFRKIVIDGLSAEPSCQLLLIGGRTGSKKTKLIQLLQAQSIDLEGLASHRGSAFGLQSGILQPSQQTFENNLFLELLTKQANTGVRNLGLLSPQERDQKRDFLSGLAPSLLAVEDESRLIGRLVLPTAFFAAMQTSRCVVINASLEARIENIFEDYVRAPLQQGSSPDRLLRRLLRALRSLERKLGGQMANEIKGQMGQAFGKSLDRWQEHDAWIAPLLSNYYDRFYDHSLERREKLVLFKGKLEECYEFCRSHLDRSRTQSHPSS